VPGGDLLEVFLPAEAPGCGHCSTFLGTLEEELTVGEARRVWHVADVKGALEAQVVARKRACEGAGTSSDQKMLGCGPVLGVEMIQDADRARGVATLKSISPAAAGLAQVKTEEVPIEPFSTRAEDAGQQVDAAQTLANRLAVKYLALRGAAVAEQHVLDLQPARYCGVTVSIDSDFASRPPNSAVFAIRDGCQNSELVAGFRSTASTFRGVKEIKLLQVGSSADPGVPIVELDAHRPQDGIAKCAASLTVNGKPMYSMAAFVDSKQECSGDDRSLQWRHAGEQLATQLGVFYAQPASQSSRAGSPWWHAALISGARHLESSSGRSGWGWAAADIGLLAAGVVFSQLSVSARNDAAMSHRGVEKANALLGIGIASFGLVVPLRALSGWLSFE